MGDDLHGCGRADGGAEAGLALVDEGGLVSAHPAHRHDDRRQQDQYDDRGGEQAQRDDWPAQCADDGGPGGAGPVGGGGPGGGLGERAGFGGNHGCSSWGAGGAAPGSLGGSAEVTPVTGGPLGPGAGFAVGGDGGGARG